MAMENFATPYPLIFFDGEVEHEKGPIGVHSILNFKRFQALLSQKIGLPAKQLSAAFFCKRTTRDKEKHKKLPINENTNFNIILNQHNPSREKDCYFLVSIKKSKKERKGATKRRITGSENGDEDESVSPRGHMSMDELAEADGRGTDTSLPDIPSPKEHDQSVSPVASGQIDESHYRVALEGKLSGTKKILLRRESEQQPSIGNSNAGWLDGFGVDCTEGANPPVRIESNTLRRSTVTRQHLPAHMLQKQRVQAEAVGHNHSIQLDEPVQLQTQNDSITSPGRLTLLQRNSIFSPAAYATPFTRSSTFSSLVYPSSAGVGMVRVPSGGPGGLISGLNTARNLQEAQAHYLSLQMQHPLQMRMNTHVFTKAMDGIRRCTSFENGSHQSTGVCGYCCTFKERNVNPMPFHLCAQDRVIIGFHGPSPAGPIERPVKRLQTVA